MTQEKIFQINLRQLQETFNEYLDTINSRDKLTRLKETTLYLRNMTLILERIENEQLRTAPHLTATRVIRNYKGRET